LSKANGRGGRDGIDHDNVVPLVPRKQPARYAPLLLVCCAMLVSLALLLVDFRLGALALAASVILALVLRTVLPPRRAGLLVVRSRTLDITVLASMAVGLLVLAIIVPPPPG